VTAAVIITSTEFNVTVRWKRAKIQMQQQRKRAWSSKRKKKLSEGCNEEDDPKDTRDNEDSDR
jgi:hypothetical protein